jgi:hypothetical protein
MAPVHTPIAGTDIVGVARNLGSGELPLNGLRHPATAGTSGWYLWAGQELSDTPDFFEPLHAEHLAEICPDVLPFLSLPPGWRFLLAGAQVDVWFEESLLVV